MNKLSFNATWLLALIPIGVVIFVVAPQIKNTYDNFQERVLEHQTNVYKLDALTSLDNPTTKAKNEISRLNILVTVHGEALRKERFTYYKIMSMLGIMAVMFLGMFGSSFLTRRQKSSPNNKEITFHYANPLEDDIGQYISWSAVKGSSSNFRSESLKKTKLGYKISSTNYMKFFAWGFFFVGINQAVWTFVEAIKYGTDELTIMKIGGLFFTSGGIFMIVGLFLLVLTGTKVIIDTQNQRMIFSASEIIPFQQIHALQVLQKISRSSSSSSSYPCYEVNLVTKKGERHNLFNHGDKTFILSDMAKISKELQLPVWNSGVV
ncbi:hypothetical protein [Flammeovirga sp. SJP92]|uniref:hypothetical protein n=1 Tax=Flammeovirga sp. SJP92 TaxID=1775430 RepID=UPI00078969AA|nr:hypothetical protein [Flammeovirga sp. SJP92]KXX71393.1 hypothetical protein AVL50_05690 [Flammeovirga sp. SJP92]